MATFAANLAFVDFHPVVGPVDGFGSARMADQAVDRDGTFEGKMVATVVAGSQTPTLAIGVPGDGTLHEKSVEIDQVRAALVARADDHRDRVICEDKIVPVLGRNCLAMPQSPVLAIDAVAASGGRVGEFGIGRFGVGGNFGQRTGMGRL